jgi:hypothetical protein
MPLEVLRRPDGGSSPCHRAGNADPHHVGLAEHETWLIVLTKLRFILHRNLINRDRRRPKEHCDAAYFARTLEGDEATAWSYPLNIAGTPIRSVSGAPALCHPLAPVSGRAGWRVTRPGGQFARVAWDLREDAAGRARALINPEPTS